MQTHPAAEQKKHILKFSTRYLINCHMPHIRTSRKQYVKFQIQQQYRTLRKQAFTKGRLEKNNAGEKVTDTVCSLGTRRLQEIVINIPLSRSATRINNVSLTKYPGVHERADTAVVYEASIIEQQRNACRMKTIQQCNTPGISQRATRAL